MTKLLVKIHVIASTLKLTKLPVMSTHGLLYMRSILVTVCIFICSGCTVLETQYKCKDGIIYVRSNGAWIQALGLKDNKCLEENDK